MKDDLEAGIRRLEDRALISERVIGYAVAVDRRDWEIFGECFTDPLYADYSENGLPAADFARDELVRVVREAVSSYAIMQHLSPNHIIEFLITRQVAERPFCLRHRRFACRRMASGQRKSVLG